MFFLIAILSSALANTALEMRIFQRQNEVRTNPRAYAGTSYVGGEPAPPLTYSPTLSKIALSHCLDTKANGHTGGDGSTVGQRVERYGQWKRRVAENIAYGESDAQNILLRLYESPGHRRNLLNK
jgi:uncharacterized protein YkwD